MKKIDINPKSNIDIASLTGLISKVFWMDTDCRSLGFNKQSAKLFSLKANECNGLPYDDMAKLASWNHVQGNLFLYDNQEVISSEKPKERVFEPPSPHLDSRISYLVTIFRVLSLN